MNITKVVATCNCGNSMSRDVFTERTNVACRVCGGLYDVVVQHCETCGTRRSGFLQRGASFPTFCEKCKPQLPNQQSPTVAAQKIQDSSNNDKVYRGPIILANPYNMLGTWLGTTLCLALSIGPESALMCGSILLIVLALAYKHYHY